MPASCRAGARVRIHRQAERVPGRTEKGARISLAPRIGFEAPSSGKGKQSFPKQPTDGAGISGPGFTQGELIVASLPMAAADFQLPVAGSSRCLPAGNRCFGTRGGARRRC